MRVLLRVLLALGALLIVQSRASAYVNVDIDLSSQSMRVHSTNGESYVWPISSGRTGYATPRGVFHAQRLYVMVHSAKYNNAPMPHSIFFHGQYAIHGTMAVGALGSPASHGCVRLSPANAAVLFAMVQSQGAQIRITGSAGGGEVAHARHRHADSALAFAPVHRARSLNEWARNPVAR